ncbi:MAG TPA: MoaD/ThiS family protein [Candidatus Corynebacterium gallistercoris]|uniref:MoaD/ThiS family protein n=1 Tax=Candidatus Corynebacterium gallistercoris TaxID=2838530 RepID=A0A9D1URE0_9CORY|nr:MoaD/ThiS family protein [Candidatus Corynebacterium gallistercoris]
MTVRYFAAARAARGTATEQLDFTGPLGDLLTQLGEKHTDITAGGLTLAQIFPRCTFLLNGARVEDSATVQPGDQLDILPPFAGG